MKTVLVTGGVGFIGSSVVHTLLSDTDVKVVNLDCLTYAANLASLADIADDQRYTFEQVDIRNAAEVGRVFATHKPDTVLHLAAESHVDRSIEGPAEFIETNILGTYTLLEAALVHFKALDGAARDDFRFLHVSTDEVFGSLGPEGKFTETTQYKPNSPYSASKASSDHLVRAWHKTFGLPVLITNCSNNYGPRQFPEKLIPLITIKALNYEPLPVYGTGENVRDWLYVDDHARAIWRVAERGQLGETYNIGGDCELTNIDVVKTVCRLVDEMRPEPGKAAREELITFVADRPGHDERYAMDITKIDRELDWKPSETFTSGMEKTVRWYLERADWWQPILDGAYDGGRLGLSKRERLRSAV